MSAIETLPSVRRYKAILFDLDGVITHTRDLHVAAWKQTFDQFLAQYEKDSGRSVDPFDEQADYENYVDGKPRYEGVRSFLEARHISLPFGEPESKANWRTIYGIGKYKNELFQKLLTEQGIRVFPDATRQLARLRDKDIKTAVVSSSRNCGPILTAAGLSDAFTLRVDGRDAKQLHLKGKPNPDIFLEATRRLGVEAKEAIVIEDAFAGVQAGRAGGFGLVLAVDRQAKSAQAFREAGADEVLPTLDQLSEVLTIKNGRMLLSVTPVATGKNQDQDFYQLIHDRDLALFFDYDGTLTPIVDDPRQAVLSEEMREALKAVKNYVPVAVVSGRDRPQLESMVGLEGLYYAGSHGFDCDLPDDGEEHLAAADKALPALKELRKEWESFVEDCSGTQLEVKAFSVALHVRHASEEGHQQADEFAHESMSRFPQLRLMKGKQVYEAQPDIDWDKGKAVRRIFNLMKQSGQHLLPVYLGDDTTDEDAFREVKKLGGIGIKIAAQPCETEAMFRLASVADVELLLERLTMLADID
jgi:alpha,alpha-trehalase